MTKTAKHSHARHLAEIKFPKTDYAGALADYNTSKIWCFDQGLINHPRVAGVIHSPTYEGKEVPDGTIPETWDLHAQEWQITVDLYCFKDDSTDWITNLDITPPAGAALTRTQ